MSSSSATTLPADFDFDDEKKLSRSSSRTSQDARQQQDAAKAESRLVRKMDLCMMPLYFSLYLLCFLDRTK